MTVESEEGKASKSAQAELGGLRSARERWKKVKNVISFTSRLSGSSPMDFLEESLASLEPPATPSGSEVDENESESDEKETSPPTTTKEEAPPKPEGNGMKQEEREKATHARGIGGGFRPRGRRGLEGMVVVQSQSLYCWMTNFYVIFLKLPTIHFLVAVFSAPLLLGVLFTPLFLLDTSGLMMDDQAVTLFSPSSTPSQSHTLLQGAAAAAGGGGGGGGVHPPDPLVHIQHACSTLTHIFLYAVSLSTTFGGSPISAHSPFSLILANLNTLMAQLLFVFLSGAVFARMSQPSHPVRCAKRAIVRNDDFVPSQPLSKDKGSTGGGAQTYKAFVTRLVLTGPAPCELVDVKISLTLRYFVRLPSGSMFVASHDLKLVRPEVSYLRYGHSVRHIIDDESPMYGQTEDSLAASDASFSLTLMGIERSSMQPFFHLQDYFVHDGEVVWNADFHDVVTLNPRGEKVIDHNKIDLIRNFKAGGLATQAISRMSKQAAKTREAKSKWSLSLLPLNGKSKEA